MISESEPPPSNARSALSFSGALDSPMALVQGERPLTGTGHVPFAGMQSMRMTVGRGRISMSFR